MDLHIDVHMQLHMELHMELDMELHMELHMGGVMGGSERGTDGAERNLVYHFAILLYGHVRLGALRRERGAGKTWQVVLSRDSLCLPDSHREAHDVTQIVSC